MTFKYPVGAQIRFRLVCDRMQAHLNEATVLASFIHDGAAWYVVGGLSPEVIPESTIIGRVNVRTKSEAS